MNRKRLFFEIQWLSLRSIHHSLNFFLDWYFRSTRVHPLQMTYVRPPHHRPGSWPSSRCVRMIAVSCSHSGGGSYPKQM